MLNTFHMQVLVISENEEDIRPFGLHKARERQEEEYRLHVSVWQVD